MIPICCVSSRLAFFFAVLQPCCDIDIACLLMGRTILPLHLRIRDAAIATFFLCAVLRRSLNIGFSSLITPLASVALSYQEFSCPPPIQPYLYRISFTPTNRNYCREDAAYANRSRNPPLVHHGLIIRERLQSLPEFTMHKRLHHLRLIAIRSKVLQSPMGRRCLQ